MQQPLDWVNREISEAEFQRTVVATARTFGWHAYHARFSLGADPGYPDWTFVHPKWRRVVFAELKREKGRATEKQEEWLAVLKEAGQETYLWRPSSWDEVVRVLTVRERPEAE